MLSYHNRKINHLQEALGVRCASFDLPCGWTCPFAKDCKSKVREVNGKRVLEKEGIFQCYASKAELLYPNVYRNRQINFIASKDDSFVDLIINEINTEAVKVLRVHSSGDFYNWVYYSKWREIAERCPDIMFFGYTKSVEAMIHSAVTYPKPNFHFIYSWGGSQDESATYWRLPTCYVAMGDEYDNKMPVIDASKDSVADYNYIVSGTTFAIRLH